MESHCDELAIVYYVWVALITVTKSGIWYGLADIPTATQNVQRVIYRDYDQLKEGGKKEEEKDLYKWRRVRTVR